MTNAADAQLRARAKGLAHELADFLSAREETEPRAPQAKSFHADTANLARHGQEVQAAYAADYAGRALALLDAFRERGILPRSGSAEAIFEEPINVFGVRIVMNEIGYMNEVLELRNHIDARSGG